MRAAVVIAPGEPEAITLIDVPVPEPGAGEIRVEVAAAGVNPVDLSTRGGFFHQLGLVHQPDHVGLGWDVAGTRRRCRTRRRPACRRRCRGGGARLRPAARDVRRAGRPARRCRRRRTRRTEPGRGVHRAPQQPRGRPGARPARPGRGPHAPGDRGCRGRRRLRGYGSRSPPAGRSPAWRAPPTRASCASPVPRSRPLRPGPSTPSSTRLDSRPWPSRWSVTAARTSAYDPVAGPGRSGVSPTATVETNPDARVLADLLARTASGELPARVHAVLPLDRAAAAHRALERGRGARALRAAPLSPRRPRVRAPMGPRIPVG